MKTSILGLILFLMSNIAFCQAKMPADKSIIGKVYRHINELNGFKDYQEYEGLVMQPSEAKFVLSKVANKGKNTVIVFAKILEINKQVSYRILDTLNLGIIGDKKIVMLELCRINRKNDSEIIALADYKAVAHYKLVSSAWRANRKTGKFEKIHARGVDCTDDNYSDED